MLRAITAVAVLAVIAGIPAQLTAQDNNEEFQPAEFTEDFLSDPENIARGQEIWQEQCRLCHGRDAYPGKGPTLKPRKYNPAFVYKRVTKGFRGMPSWAEVYDEYERKAVTAFVLSDKFSN